MLWDKWVSITATWNQKLSINTIICITDRSPWKEVGLNNNFILVWPDGTHDSNHNLGSWNVSTTYGPKGSVCVLPRGDFRRFECHDSCPQCDEDTTCDWTSCYDDIGFIESLLKRIGDHWCLDLDHLHMSGISNGGMFNYVVATTTDALGINNSFNHSIPKTF